MKRSRSCLPATREALAVLGAQIGIARRELGWTAAELAERVGVSAPVITRIEKGYQTTQIGAAFEAAVITGVALFGVEAGELTGLADAERNRLALLPDRVRSRNVEIDDDF